MQGKVRDVYDFGEHLLIVTTDRQSAFDRVLAAIPYKGQVLNQVSAWWFEQTAHIIPNSLVSVPDPCASVMRKCAVFPVEFVVRGYMTGSTETSLWTHYKAGAREYCGNVLQDGMTKNEKLPANPVTPTTKSAERDVPIAPADIVSQVRTRDVRTQAACQCCCRIMHELPPCLPPWLQALKAPGASMCSVAAAGALHALRPQPVRCAGGCCTGSHEPTSLGRRQRRGVAVI